MKTSSSWNGSLAPVIDSHSSAYALCPHPRNVPDDILQMTKETNGLIMVSFVPEFVSCRALEGRALPEFWPPNSTLAKVVDHIVYIVELIDPDHVGLGSDFDSIFETPRGMEDVSKYSELVAEMLRRGLTDTENEKIIGGNLLRVWGDVDAVASNMQETHQKPFQDRLRWLKRPGVRPLPHILEFRPCQRVTLASKFIISASTARCEVPESVHGCTNLS